MSATADYRQAATDATIGPTKAEPCPTEVREGSVAALTLALSRRERGLDGGMAKTVGNLKPMR